MNRAQDDCWKDIENSSDTSVCVSHPGHADANFTCKSAGAETFSKYSILSHYTCCIANAIHPQHPKAAQDDRSLKYIARVNCFARIRAAGVDVFSMLTR